jgi:hypothetical protein
VVGQKRETGALFSSGAHLCTTADVHGAIKVLKLGIFEIDVHVCICY